MKKLLLIVFISFLFTQNSNAQCDPVLTINENFALPGIPTCWTEPNGNYVIDNNNGTFGGHPTNGAVIVLREVANLEGTLVLQVRTYSNHNSGFTVERIQNNAIVSSENISTTPSWQNATLNFSGNSGRGFIRIRQYTSNAPVIQLAQVSYTSTCPATPDVIFRTNDLTVQLDGSGNATITPEQIDNGSSTTCGAAIANFSLDGSSFTCADIGSNTVTISALDGSANVIGTKDITVTVEDINAPTAIGQNIMVQASPSGDATITPAMVDNGSFDACGGAVTLSLSKTTFVCGETGIIPVTLTAEDASGNTASTEVMITVTSSTIVDQALTASNDTFCPDGSTVFPAATISTTSSEVGLEYSLRKSTDNTIIDGPLAGTGGALDFTTGGLTETTTFNVFAEYAGAGTNSALDFDGTNDYVTANLNASFDYENGYTFESWVKVAVPVGGHWPIFSVGSSSTSDIEVYIQAGTNKLVVVHDRGEATFGGYSYTVPPNNKWFQLAVTYDGTSAIKVYFDGVEQSSTDNSYAPSGSLTKSASMTMKIGKVENTAFGAGGGHFLGQLDEVRIWTKSKTAGEILADKDNCLTGSETNLEYYFPFDNNTGIVATELVNGSYGTLTNMDANTDWVASGTGFSCAKYTNSCGFQMLTEVKVGDATPPTAVAQNISVQIDAGTGLATISAGMVDNGSSDNCGGAVTLDLSKSEFGCGDIGANAVDLIVEDAAGNQTIANVTVTVTSSINDETVTASAANFCPGGGGSVDITTGSSVNGIDYYLRDNSDNTIIDGPISGTGSGLTFNSGVLSSTTTFNVYGELPSSVSNALAFDGVDDYIVSSVPVGFNYSSAYTMETWVKAPLPGSTGGYPSPFFVGTSAVSDIEVYVQQGTNNLIVVHNRGNGGTLSYGTFPSPPNNVWYHLAVVYNGTNIEVFYNGISQGSFAILAPLATGGANINIGYIASSVFNQPPRLNGQLDDYRLWSTAKSGTAINANKNSCLVGDEAGLKTYYKFDEGSGLIATDLANSNNGTLTNMDGATDWITDVAISCGQSCGFEMTSTPTVTVGDAINPTAIVQNTTIQLDATGNANITPADINNGSTDNCTASNNLILSLDKTAFTCADLEANTVTLTVEDALGNQGTATATVTVVDAIAPTAVSQEDITIQLDASGNASITTADINNGSTDNCTAANNLVLSLDKTAFTCADLGVNTVTLTVEDGSGNQSTTTAAVMVVDVIIPVAIAQNITVQLDAMGNATVTAAQVDNGSTDNCSSGASLLLSLSQSTFGCADLGANNITFTAEDASGNQAITTATVTVEDNLAPTAIAKDITVNLDGSGNASITAAQLNNGSTDNCTATSDLVLSIDKSSFVLADLGANTVTLTVADANGNSSTATSTVTVEEKTSQTITFAGLANKTYGDASFTVSATATSSLAVSYTVVSGPATITGSDVSITGAGSVIIEANQAGDATFAAAPAVQQSFTVNPAALTATANDKAITYGEAIPTLTFSYSGFVNGEDVSALTAEPTATTTATAVSDAGTYPITLAGGIADNYAFSLTDGSLTINKADQTITLTTIADQDITQVTSVDVTATASSGLATTLTVTGPATISGTTITLTGTVGTVTVIASQAGGTNYNAATDATTSFEAFDSTDPCFGFAVSLGATTNNNCNGAAEGAIDITVTGGDGNYSFAWDNNTTTEDATNLGAGTYTVTVTDGNGCTVTLTETISEPSLIEVTATTTDVVAGNDGAADITVTGGTGAYTFSWSNGADTEDISNVAAGNYTVTVTDANGCSVSQAVEVGDIITNIEDVEATTLQIYPNPVSDYLTLEGTFENKKVEVQVINNSGQQMLTKRFDRLTSNQVQVELTNIKNGQYLVIINSNNTQTVQRINIKH